MDCPLCRKALKPLAYEGCTVHACETCGGEFVAGEDLATIVRTRHERFPETIAEQARARTPEFGVFCEARALACPACEHPMHTVNYSGDTGVCVDRCSVCAGVWLDREELERIQALLEEWHDRAPERIRAIAGQLELARA